MLLLFYKTCLNRSDKVEKAVDEEEPNGPPFRSERERRAWLLQEKRRWILEMRSGALG